MFSNRITIIEEHNATLQILPTTVKDVVSWYASFYTFPSVANEDFLLQDMAVAMLDKGTKRQDKFAIAEKLESRGAQLRFYSDGLRVGFFGRSLREDLPVMFEVLTEQLYEPLFDPEEFEKVRLNAIAGRQRALTNTRARAEVTLHKALYAPSHPNYLDDAETEIKQLQNVSLADIKQYHQTHFGAREVILSAAGDTTPDEMHHLYRHHLGDWHTHHQHSDFEELGKPQAAGRSVSEIADRQNLDVYFAQTLPFGLQHPDYLPMYVGTYILGGNFSARLMQTVRDEQGLTYGIGSGLAGMTQEYAGHWQTNVTLSQENLEKGIEATQEQINKFVAEGITEAELEEKKTTLTGKYKVELATTAGLARTMQMNAEEGFNASWMDEYPESIQALTAQQINDVVQNHLHPDQLHIAIAGTMPGE